MTALRIHRRQFLKRAGIVTAMGMTLPSFLKQSTPALAASPIAGLPDDRVLVLIQLAGGNDGLNTLIPYEDDIYYRSRPTLSIPREEVLKLDDHCGLHPEMYALQDLWEQGELALIQNVGYPNPDLSHFRSTEIWETASPSDQNWSNGWIGRYFDNECQGTSSPLLGLQLGERTAQTFSGDRPRCVTFSNPDLFQFSGGASAEQRIAQLNSGSAIANPALDFLQRTGNDVLSASRQVGEAVRNQKTTVDYLPYQFSQSLKLVAQMIAAEVPTRVYYVSLGGFDHHATQKMRHAMLLQELSEGLGAFIQDLRGLGHLDRTLVMTFSEFGRRVAENQNVGTDHGTANVMFMAGGTTKPGLHGTRADLSHLDSVGDLIYTTDFRSIYATILQSWLQADLNKVGLSPISPLEGLLA